MNFDLTRELAPNVENDASEFYVDVIPAWENREEAGFEKSMNRYGAVYVRLVSAQR